jgi:ferredoxin
MSYMISMECINCGACEYECPARAISPSPSQFLIDAGVCVECDGHFDVPRCKSVCPVGACGPLNPRYLERMRSLSARGIVPLVLHGPG